MKQRDHSIPSSCSSEPLLHCTKKKRYASLRLIDPLNVIAPLSRKKKVTSSTILKPKPGRFSQPSKPTSSSSLDAISHSLSLIRRFNQWILSNLINDSDTESLEVNKTMEVGDAFGFNMVGKEKDVAHALGTGLDKKSMLNVDDRFLIQSVWGHSTFDYALNKANGKSGGIVDTSKGDFNEVLNENERLGSHFCRRSASFFNEFILSAGLLDLPIRGMHFTRMNSIGLKLSKIDRILKDHQQKASSLHSKPTTPIDEIDRRAEFSPLSATDVDVRIEKVKLLAEMEHHKLKDLRPKDKMK
ncbi:hypothetical protein Tco_0840315 [Tanacetum coccineum]|uniref:Uncharacterized protein n=1 Tax=Tanacetum coccineum TaxID=301880 RepID=A0ABQ5AX68_9ASTR